MAPNAKLDLVERLAPVATVLGSMSFNDEGGIEIPEFLISADTSVLVLQNFPLSPVKSIMLKDYESLGI